MTSDEDAVGKMVLNALVQDVVRGVAFLHSHRVAHCDIKVCEYKHGKFSMLWPMRHWMLRYESLRSCMNHLYDACHTQPANVLCAFDRSGKARKFKPRYWHEAQLKLTDFGVSRVISQRLPSDSASTTATVSLDEFKNASGIAGTQSYMSRELLTIVEAIRTGVLNQEPDVSAPMLFHNDAFGLGCVVAFICSGGQHPFQHALLTNILSNILANRRHPLEKMAIVEPRHVELVDKLNNPDADQRWTVQQAMQASRIFDNMPGHSDDATILLDEVSLRTKPKGSCREQLLSPAVIAMCSSIPTLMPKIDRKVALLMDSDLTPTLDEDSCFAIVAYSMDNGSQDVTSNVFCALNKALRDRKSHPEQFESWKGFLYFLLAALEHLPKVNTTVSRGGNSGLHQAVVSSHYSLGRPIQWAGFSSTSTRPINAKQFVRKDEGVLFNIKVMSGRNIVPWSYFPREDEVLPVPNTRFVVTREMYMDADGYANVDLAETQGSLFTS